MLQERHCFSIVFRHPILFHKSIDLVAESEEEAKAWILALRHLIVQNKKQTLHFNEVHFTWPLCMFGNSYQSIIDSHWQLLTLDCIGSWHRADCKVAPAGTAPCAA